MLTLLKLELQNCYQSGIASLYPIFFFMLVLVLWSVVLGGSPHLLALTAPVVLVLAAVLAHLLSSDLLFERDHAQGILIDFLLSPKCLTQMLSVKIFSSWITTSMPLILLSLPLSYALNLSAQESKILFIGLCLSTPIIHYLIAISSALTLALQGRQLLLPVLVLPMLSPVLILASSAVVLTSQGEAATTPLYLLASILCLTLTCAPFAVSRALRLGV